MNISQMSEKRNFCIRCGECCLRSAPSLQKEDIPLVLEGHIRKKELFTIRTGETLWDNVREEVRQAAHEIVKVKDIDGVCVFYDDPQKACRIYGHRPSQCAALECWNPSKFMGVYAGPKADRDDFVEKGVLRELIREHDKRCAYEKLASLVEQITSRGEAVVERIMEMLKFDYHLRPFICKKMGIDPDETDFLFGRPLVDTISQFGLQVIRQPDGSFFLTTLVTDA